MLCSDGLSSMLTDTRIRQLALEDTAPDVMCERLVEAANRAGGEDNVTVVVFELTEGEPPERSAPPPPAAEASEAAVEPAAESARESGAFAATAPETGVAGRRLLFLLAVLLVGALALWWGITR